MPCSSISRTPASEAGCWWCESIRGSQGGTSSRSRATQSHRAGCRRESGRPVHLLIVPERKVVERSPSQGESLAGASPARNTNFSARGSRGIADPPDSESGSLERASRSAPTISHFPRSSTVEPPAVNRQGGGANPSAGAALLSDHGVTAAPLFVRQKARGRHPLVTPIWLVRRPSKRTAAAARASAPPPMRRERYPGRTPIYG